MVGNGILRKWDTPQIWNKYCGFLDLSMQEFKEIQEYLLLEQLEFMATTPIGKKLMGGAVPDNIAEFRRTVPITVYDDYIPLLNQQEQEEDNLPEKPVCWAHTSGRSGVFKWVPMTERAYEIMGDHVVAVLLLAAADRKGEVKFKDGDRGVYNTPPRPYFSGVAVCAGAEKLGLRFIPPLELSEKMEFEERIAESFKMALRDGVDFVGSMTSVLIKVGEAFTERSSGLKFSQFMLHPAVLMRIAKAIVRSRMERRAMLPRDLWSVRAIVCSGTDTAIYRDQVVHYWGKTPYEVYACTEGGIMAFQSWTKEGMTFTPYSVFLEFIPEEESHKSREDPEYCPRTVLLDEVEEGKRYEVLISSFYGMPFLRYRVGDFIKIVSLKDKETGIELPQMLFDSRADDLIDLAGFVRLDEKTVWKAIINAGLNSDDWTIRKEFAQGNPSLHLYLEPKDNHHNDDEEVSRLIDNSLASLDLNYADLDKMLGLHPLRVTILAKGSFQRYYEEKKTAGFDLAHLKPPHMNASDDIIESLLRLSQ